MTSLTQNFLNPNNKPLVIGEFTIRQNTDGLYCLHDLHKASGSLEKHQPAFFMRNKQTKDLIDEIENSANLQSLENERSANLQIAVKIIKGGASEQGTYVVKELVYAYAMWVSAKFHLMVIRAYDALVMDWLMNDKITVSPEQCGILYNIVHTRAGGNKNVIVKMWSKLKNHFKYSASYRELKAIHFEDAKHYLEVMDLDCKTEKPAASANDVVHRLEDFINNLSLNYPNLQSPIAYEVAKKISETLRYSKPSGHLVYWVAINNHQVSVHQYTPHHAPVDILKLTDSLKPFKDFMIGYEIEIQARELKKTPV